MDIKCANNRGQFSGQLFEACIRYLEQNGELGDTILQGIGIKRKQALINLCLAHPVVNEYEYRGKGRKLTKEYICKGRQRIDGVLNDIQFYLEYLEDYHRKIVLFDYFWPESGHSSCITKVGNKLIYLLDSDGEAKINRKKVTARPHMEKYQIPTERVIGIYSMIVDA